MENNLTQERLKEVLDYCELTGIFTRKITVSSNAMVGAVAGCTRPDGYLVISIDGRSYRAHRLAWLYMKGAFPEEVIDHENHMRSDNRKANLKAVSRQDNNKNLDKRKNNKSGFTGVSWNKGKNKWGAYIQINYKRTHLGLFDDLYDAVKARKAKEVELGFHKNHGKVINESITTK